MKKVVFLIVFVVFINLASAECQDSDEANNPLLRGRCELNSEGFNAVHADDCRGSWLRQCQCSEDGSSIWLDHYSCSGGCEEGIGNGECISFRQIMQDFEEIVEPEPGAPVSPEMPATPELPRLSKPSLPGERMGKSYIFAGSQRLAEVRDNTLSFYHPDHLGSTVKVTDEDGNIVSSADYMPFGSEIRFSGSVANRFRYTGKELDSETDWYYYGARYYDPELGRFVSVDPIVDGVNRYAYVENNPLRLVDSTGNSEESSRKNAYILMADYGTVWGLSIFKRRYTSKGVEAALQLKEIYKQEGYETEILIGYQSDPTKREVMEKRLGTKMLSEEETIGKLKEIFANKDETLLAVFGHGTAYPLAMLTEIIPGAPLGAKSGRSLSAHLITSIETQRAELYLHQIDYSKGYPSSTPLKAIASPTRLKCETYNCALIEGGEVSTAFLPLITSMRSKTDYSDIRKWVNEMKEYSHWRGAERIHYSPKGVAAK